MTTIPFIDLKSQYEALKPEISQRIQNVLDHGQYIMGPEVSELEEKLAGFTGAKYCITVASGTEALLISLMALGIGPGDEVITTPFTFIATVEVIVLLRAKPVFVDIDPDTCNIDVSKIEEKISPKTKAIMPVSLYGQTSDMDEINLLAQRYGDIPVIEDGAQSFGATYKDKKSCNLSTFGCTSFFPSKPLGCYGDGGAIFTNDSDLAALCKSIRVHGQSERYVHTAVGVGGRMDTLQCAILLAKLPYFSGEIARRAEIGGVYDRIADAHGIKRVKQLEYCTSVFAQYTIFLSNREYVVEVLKRQNIPSAIHYPVPVNRQPAYTQFCCPDCTPQADLAASQVLSLPMSPHLSEQIQRQIMKTVSS